MERLRGVPGLNVSDFGTRRRHSFLWQEYVVNSMARRSRARTLPAAPTPSSPTSTTSKPSAPTRTNCPWRWPLSRTPTTSCKSAQYRLLELWQQSYQGELLILLPDTFGTTQFLRDAPDWVADWTGQRIDSKDPFVAGDEYIAWLEERGRDPRKKRLIASDSLDVDVDSGAACLLRRNAAQWRIAGDFPPRQRLSGRDPAGFPIAASASAPVGALSSPTTSATATRTGDDRFDPVSLVCKLSEVDGRPAVKLSDNYSKAMGRLDEDRALPARLRSGWGGGCSGCNVSL